MLPTLHERVHHRCLLGDACYLARPIRTAFCTSAPGSRSGYTTIAFCSEGRIIPPAIAGPCRFSYDRPRAGPTQCLTLLPHSADPGRHKGALIQIGIGEQPQYQGRQASR